MLKFLQEQQFIILEISAFSKPGPYLGILSRLNGNICLIKGNHDRLKPEVRDRFCWVKDYYESKTEDGRKIVMCHYPFLTWNKAHHGAWMLHGHSHGNLRAPETTRMDVGIDTRDDFAPYSFDEIEKIMSKRSYLIVDHHKPRKR